MEAAAGISGRDKLFGFYPEGRGVGTRSPDGRTTGPGRARWLRDEHRAPVIPLAMIGTRKMLPPCAPLPARQVEIKIGQDAWFGYLASGPAREGTPPIAGRGDAQIADLYGQE